MNFIQKHCLNQRLNGFIQKRKGEQTSIYTLKEANSICFFITLDIADKLTELVNYVSALENKKTVIICYFNGKKLPENMEKSPILYTVSRKDISITGRVREQVREKIFSQHYNIFIDMDTETDLISLYLKSLPNADFRIGRNEKYYNYFDFTLCAGEQYNIKEYISNVEKYTSKLKGN